MVVLTDDCLMQVVKQVFTKLDVDVEGRISFEEFLQLFRSTHSAAPQPHQHSAVPYQQQNLNSLDVTSSGYYNLAIGLPLLPKVKGILN